MRHARVKELSFFAEHSLDRTNADFVRERGRSFVVHIVHAKSGSLARREEQEKDDDVKNLGKYLQFEFD